jgi:phenylalanyl-tRNA synthetase beta chain
MVPGRTAQLMTGGRPSGAFGELHPAVADRFGLKGMRVLVAELDVSTLTATASDRHISKSVPVFPPIREDIAVIVADDVPAARVCEVVRAAGGTVLAGVTVFDVYRAEQIGAGKKSLALGLTYQAPDRTLTDADAEKIRNRIVQALATEVGGALRA